MTCHNVECDYCNVEKYEFSELCCVRCLLKHEMKECKTCKTNNNKLKKANNRLTESIVDLINSFNACKRCIKTIDTIKNEPKDLNKEELNIWYFTKLNPLPSRTVLNKQLGLRAYYLQTVSRCNYFESLNFYHYYKDWFKELWKPQTFNLRQVGTMINIMRIMFSINGMKYKLEYSKIFNEEFFRVNVFDYINHHTPIRY